MDKTILTILTSGVVSAGIATLLIFIFKSWISERIKGSIQHEYDQKLVAYEAQLKAASDVSIEQLKSQLQITAAERSIKLSKVFEQQADTIAETYAKLVDIISAIGEYTAIMEFSTTPPKAERRLKVGDKMMGFLSYYRPRRIYLPKETQAKIDAFVEQLHQITMKFMFDVEQRLQRPVEKAEDDTWMKTIMYLNKDCVEIMSALDADLKRILGLSDEQKTQ
jgi:hypothetical protein